MAALTARGISVQPFKVGPDFIDPSHHTKICGRPSRNLDPFMMGEDGVRQTFCRAAGDADIAVIEGVMGLFDGIDGSDLASSAHVARILNAPVILVIDAKGMSTSANALIKGYREFDSRIYVAGVIFNRIGSERHRAMIESSLDIPSFGWLPRTEDLAIASRHLGLKMAHESAILQNAGSFIEKFCDLDAIASLAQRVPAIPQLTLGKSYGKISTRLAVARDPAFCFYYQDNLDLMQECGAELTFFSPLKDSLPDVDAVYLGGGYPELHLPALESAPCRKELKTAIDDGMPVYAECGGMMFLGQDICTDRTYRMCGVLPAHAEMSSHVQALGYVRGSSQGGMSFVPNTEEFKGHEFHYSRMLPEKDSRFAFRLSRGKGIESGKDGLIEHNAIGTYTHSYFTPAFVQAFVKAAHRYSKT
jgi:cobyrinic acid a,c-diamide synthase